MSIAPPLALLVLLVACGRPDAVAFPEDPLTDRHATRHEVAAERAPTPALERPAMVRFHMQRHFDDLRTIERALVAGKLEEATTLAYLLSKPASDHGLVPLEAESTRVVVAATALVRAADLDEACRREAQIAAACANCHERAHAHPEFTGAPAPADHPDLEARMARHQWAVDRLWEGMIGADDDRWQAGLVILAGTPPPRVQPNNTAHLQELARAALGKTPTSVDDKAVVYGELLVACAACHATLGRIIGARK